MKKTLILFVVIFCSICSKAQKDTLVIILDRNADYVYFEDNAHIDKYDGYDKKYIGKIYFNTIINSNYYEGTEYDYIAGIKLTQLIEGYRNIADGRFLYTIPNKKLNKMNTISGDEINTSTYFYELDKILDPLGFRRVLYVAFKHDIENEYINLYRVESFMYEVIE